MDGEQQSTAWGAIKLIHEIIQNMTHSLTKTVKTMCQIYNQDNKQAADTDNNAFEVNKLISPSINKGQILKDTLNQINMHMLPIEAETHPSISKVYMAV